MCVMDQPGPWGLKNSPSATTTSAAVANRALTTSATTTIHHAFIILFSSFPNPFCQKLTEPFQRNYLSFNWLGRLIGFSLVFQDT
jgi:hypothetical protein